MKRSRNRALLAVSSIAFLTLVSVSINPKSANRQNQPPPAVVREDAYRANNIGVALLEQFKHKEAADAFRKALQLDPKLVLARINLGIALYNVPDLPGAQREMQSAIEISPVAPQPYYMTGLIAKVQNRQEDAVAAFQRVLKIDPKDVGTNVNLGQLYAQQRRYPEAIAVLRTALAAEPYNATALYNLGTALLRAGQRDEGQSVIKQFQELRQRGSGTTIGTNYLEQGRYAEAISSTGAEAELVDRTAPAVTFTDATAEVIGRSSKPAESAGASAPLYGRQFQGELSDGVRNELVAALGGNVTLFDFDADGDLDLFWISPAEQHLYRNDYSKFTDVTWQSGALSAKFTGTGVGAVSGDYDNDGKPDLFIIRYGSLGLYHNDGGKFSDVAAAAGIPTYPYLPSSVAFVDVDHDGDLDIFIAGLADLTKVAKDKAPAVFPDDFAAARNMLLRNDGNGKFTDVTAIAKLDRPGHSTAVVPTDFNNKRDVDLLVVNYGKTPELFSNQRDGAFRNVAGGIGLAASGRWTSAAAGDLNKDGYTDFFFGQADGPALFAISDGQEKFKTSAAPSGSEGVRSAQFLDYDNDGLLDTLALTDKGLRVWRNVGNGWTDVSGPAVAVSLAGKLSQASRLFAAGDIDVDGDEDLVFLSSSGELLVGRNDGGNTNRSLRVNLAAKVSNRSAVGAKIEARAGSLWQKLETYSASPAPAPADLIFGLGKRTTADAMRVLWPAGIVQAETDIAKAQPLAASTSTLKKTPSALMLSVTELDRKPSSCPYLYVWNGESFEFVTDFMGGGEMGHLEEPRRYNLPDPDEYVRIRSDQLKERHGRYELRVTNELEEALFLDHLQLIAVAHPQGVEVYPNEGLTGPPLSPFKIYSTRGAQPPISAVDDHGHDVLSRIARLDREYPDDFRPHHIRGYADEHTLTLKLIEDPSKGGSSKVQRPTSNVRLRRSATNAGLTNSSTTKRTLGIGHRTLDGDEARRPERIVLLLTGWTDYAWSSDNLAASQSGKSMMPPALQVKDERGRWRTVIENIGIPVGRPQSVTVDLTGKFLSSSREVRIVTNMRIYWDQIQVDTSSGNHPVQMTKLDPFVANLRWRGFSREFSPDGRQPLGYDYEDISFTSPWKVMTGHYTREGDVRELLLKSDDMFVISRPGDEISLSFNAVTLPPLPRGWARTFLLYADGFSKEMDINSASPDQVGPLPFHGMTKYPYTWPERYPLTEVRRRYLEKYNTRVVTSPVPSIETELLGHR
ncbi:MAG TPA: FG-GAP-like repeat-containing protein [Pyrinomonadaceae bacterium]|nr:FG-GAP-like repeat-containing protein [Pyrinomonadaceae bacterium]